MKQRLISWLKWSEQYTKTDMVYLASGTFWGNLNAAVVSLLAFAASIFFARYLTKESYGTYQYILSIASLIGAVTLTGMNSAVTRAVARGFEGELSHAIRYQLKASVIPFIFGLCISLWYFIHGNYVFTVVFAWIAIFLPLQNVFNTWVAYLGGKKFFRVGTYYGLANNIANYTVILLTLYFTHSYLWLIFINFAFTAFNSFVMYQIAIRHIPPNTKRDNETLSYGTHLSVMGILGVFASQLDSLLVFHFVGSAALAVYSFATIIPERLTGILKFIPNIAMPKLAERNEAEVRTILKKRLWMLFVMIAAVAGIYAAFAPWLFHTFFPAYTDSILFTQVYSLSFFSLATSIVLMALTSQRKTRELYILNVTIPIVRALLMLILMYYYSIWGLLWAQILINFFSLGLQLYLFSVKRPAVTAS
jgi:O-antigen/teichoic acid export membrane protein